MEFLVLGPLRVRFDDRLIRVGAAKQRTLLGVLLVHVNQVVSVDRLLDEVWGDRQPAGGVKTLRYHISKLRDVLEPNRSRGEEGVIISDTGGYMLRATQDQVDAGRFEALAGEGTQLLADGDAWTARKYLGEALGLWRGAAFEDFRYDGFAQGEIARLEEMRLACLENRISADLELGRHHDVVGELRELTTRFPLRERLWGFLMVALYRSDQQAEALRAYQTARTVLGEELGIEPNTALQRLEEQILLHELPFEPPETELPRHMDLSSTATFLFTDIEGSTRLWEDHPNEMAGVLADHDRLVREAIESQGGRVFSTAGDGFAAVFPSVGAAVEAAVNAQLNTEGLVAGGEPVRVRMAVHSGEVEERDGGFFGPVLNRCARLRDAAHGGQVLVSLAAEQLLNDRFPEAVTVLDVGEHRLRDLSRPERIFQLCHSDLESEFPPLRSLAGLSTNLPIQVTSFVGRVQESAELDKLIRGSRLVTVTGAGGCGKSRLAVQVAAEMLDEFGDGVWLIELASLSDPELLVSTVITELGIREQSAVPPIEALTGYLRSKTALLVVDNCEHLIAPIAAMVAHLLSHTEGVRVLATSREPLHIRGETVYHLPTLPVPEPDDDWDTLVRTDSVRLFVERADAAHPGFRVTHTNAPSVASICTHLDGIPLAVELAAATTRLMSPDQIDQRLGDRFRLLTGGARDDLDHHRTLQAAIDWSYQLLTPTQQAVFARLAVFAGDFTIEAAEQVCAHQSTPTGGIWETIVQLADRSLLETEETETGVRYGMLETIRAYALDRFDALPDQTRNQLNERHCRHFLSLAEEAQPGPISADPPPRWLADLDAATFDLRQAFGWAIDTGHEQYAVDLAGALSLYWGVRGKHPEAVHWCRLVPLHSETVSVRSRSRALRCAAGHMSGAGTYAERVDFTDAQELADESLRLARQTGDLTLIAASLSLVGSFAFSTGDPQTVAILEEGIATARRAGDTWREANFRHLLALHHRDNGGRLGDHGEVETARRLFEENLLIYRWEGDDRSIGMTLGFLGNIAHKYEGDLDKASRFLEESLAIGRALNDFGLTSTTLDRLGQVAYLKGDLRTAQAIHEEEADLTRHTQGTDDIPAIVGLGMVAYAKRDLASARRLLRKALSGLREIGELDTWAAFFQRRALWGLGMVLTREEAPRQAAVLVAAVEAATQMLSPWIDPKHEPAEHQRCVALIESSLTPKELRQAQQQGAAMTLDQATDYALNLLDTTATRRPSRSFALSPETADRR